MIKRILGNKNIRNGIWLYLLQIFNTVIPLITLPYITRILGAEGYGTFSVALNVVGYLQVLIEYGFGMSATREVAVSDKEQSILNSIFTNVICARIILFLLSACISITYLSITRSESILWVCLMIMTSSLIGYCFQQNWLFQGMQEMKYISIISIIARTISTILVFVIVHDKNDLIAYSILYSISPLISGFTGFAVAKNKFHVNFIKVTLSEVLDELKKGWYVFTTQLSSKVFGAIGITFLGLFASRTEVGTFSAIQKIPNIMMLAWAPISQVVYPISSQKMQISFAEGEKFIKRMRKIFLGLFVLVAVIVAIFAKYVVLVLFGAEYVDSFYWIYPLLAWMIVAINNNFIGIQTLLASGHDKQYSVCFQISVTFTILLNLLLTFFFKGNGASIAPVLSELILLVSLTIQLRKIRKQV